MSGAWRAVTDAASLVVATLYRPIRRRREHELRTHRDIRNILVLNDVRGLGNMVLLSGLLLNLRRLYPGARLTVAMPSCPLAHAVIGPALADEIVCFDTETSRRTLFPFAWKVLRPRHFDLGLATFFSSTLLTAWVLLLAGCRYRVAYAQSRKRGLLNTITLLDGGGHELDRHLRLLQISGEQLDRRTAVQVSPRARRDAAEFLTRNGLGIERPVLGVHPGCDRVNLLKRWPIERFVRVIARVVTAGLADVVVFLGPDEMDLYDSLAACVGPRVRVVCSANFDNVAAQIGQCQAFLSNDSGLMHVAAALRVPVVVIFGPTDTVKNAPIGEAVTLISADVWCRPCYSQPPVICRRDRQYCLERIEVDQVVEALQKTLTSAGNALPAGSQGRALRIAANGT